MLKNAGKSILSGRGTGLPERKNRAVSGTRLTTINVSRVPWDTLYPAERCPGFFCWYIKG